MEEGKINDALNISDTVTAFTSPDQSVPNSPNHLVVSLSNNAEKAPLSKEAEMAMDRDSVECNIQKCNNIREIIPDQSTGCFALSQSVKNAEASTVVDFLSEDDWNLQIDFAN